MTVENNPTNPETRALLERILAECPDCTRGESGGPRLCRRHLPEYSGQLFKAQSVEAIVHDDSHETGACPTCDVWWCLVEGCEDYRSDDIGVCGESV